LDLTELKMLTWVT